MKQIKVFERSGHYGGTIEEKITEWSDEIINAKELELEIFSVTGSECIANNKSKSQTCYVLYETTKKGISIWEK